MMTLARALAQIDTAYPNARAAQRTALTAAVNSLLASPTVAKAWEGIEAQLLDYLVREERLNMSAVPTANDVTRAAIAALEKREGRTSYPSERLALAQEIEGLDETALIAKAHEVGSAKADDARAEPKQAQSSAFPRTPPSAWTDADIAEIFMAKTGRSLAEWRAIPPSQRQEIASMYRRGAEAGETDHVKGLRAIPADKRSPAARMTLERAGRGAAQRQRSGVAADSAEMRTIRAKEAQGIALSPAERMTAARAQK